MSAYDSTFSKKEQIRKKARFFRRAADNAEGLIPVIKKFDGKVYNKRFEDAIWEYSSTVKACVGYSVSVNNYSFVITCRPTYSYSGGETIVHGASFRREVSSDDVNRIFNGKRIIADKMIESLKSNQKVLRQKANQYEQIAASLDERLKRLETLKEMYRQEMDDLTYEIANDICGLRPIY